MPRNVAGTFTHIILDNPHCEKEMATYTLQVESDNCRTAHLGFEHTLISKRVYILFLTPQCLSLEASVL